VSAVQAVTYTSESVAISNGTVNQAYALQNSPVNSGSPVVYVETDPSVGPQAWSFVQDLISSNQYDEVYTLFIDANGLSNIVFGDGINGYVPPYGSQITCTYQITSGSLGNVGVNTVIQSVAAVVGLQSVTNITPASGGADPESLSSIAQKAPASLRTLSRAVTVEDFSTLAIQVPGVQWAQALMATYQLVNLYIAPAGISDDAPSTLLVSAVQEYMATRTMGNTTVTVLGPTYVPVNITVEVFCYPNYADSAVLSAVKAALVNTLSLSNTGFGFRISVGLVYQVVLGVAGVNYALVTVLNRQFMCYLSTALVYGHPVSILYTTKLPEQVSSGDKLVITNLNLATPATETVTVSSSSVAGSLSIPVITFTPNANYPIESMVEDITGVNDCVMLPNEIPVAGTLNVTVTGGISS
jgi:predicted phage baseplate assembly protein